MTREEALAFCEEHSLSPDMPKLRREAMISEQSRAFMVAYSTSDESEMNPDIVANLRARIAARATNHKVKSTETLAG